MREHTGEKHVVPQSPSTHNGTVPPKRQPYRARRPREYLTRSEVDHLMQTAHRRGRYGHRDATMILVAYRHGLRVAELCALRWDQVDLKQGLLHVQRLKQGLPSVHPLRGPELRALRRVQRDMPSASYVFTTARGSPMTSAGFRKMLARIGDASTLAFPVHPPMLRHACGSKLANEGHDTRAIQHYLGHKNIQHTVRYTVLKADRFTHFWTD
jgi:integrase